MPLARMVIIRLALEQKGGLVCLHPHSVFQLGPGETALSGMPFELSVSRLSFEPGSVWNGARGGGGGGGRGEEKEGE